MLLNVVSIVLPAVEPGGVPGVVPSDVLGVVSENVVDGPSENVTVVSGGSSHFNQILNPNLSFGFSVGSFWYEKISSLASITLVQSKKFVSCRSSRPQKTNCSI